MSTPPILDAKVKYVCSFCDEDVDESESSHFFQGSNGAGICGACVVVAYEVMPVDEVAKMSLVQKELSDDDETADVADGEEECFSSCADCKCVK